MNNLDSHHFYGLKTFFASKAVCLLRPSFRGRGRGEVTGVMIEWPKHIGIGQGTHSFVSNRPSGTLHPSATNQAIPVSEIIFHKEEIDQAISCFN